MPKVSIKIRALLLACILALAFTASAQEAAKNPIELASPQDRQVFQRQSRAAGNILLQGRLGIAGELQWKCTGTPLEGKLPIDWQTVTADPKTRDFKAAIAAPAGGWYRLELRVMQADKVAATRAVDHVGIGEVFIVAGQSNATNYGAEKQKPESDRVVSFDGTTWAPANDPQPGTHDHSTGGSFIPAFGDALAKKYHVPIAIASTGHGATSVRQWLTKGEKIEVHPTLDSFVKTVGPNQWECTGALYDHLMKRVETLGPHGFRAILWHQGESDAGQARAGYPADRQITGKQYHDLLKHLIESTQKQAGWKIPWFVAQATYHSEADPADEEFRAAQKSLADEAIAQLGPDTDALRKEYRAGVHFNPKGLKAHGQLWAQKVEAYLDKQFAKEKQ
jgi:hypothetical protein